MVSVLPSSTTIVQDQSIDIIVNLQDANDDLYVNLSLEILYYRLGTSLTAGPQIFRGMTNSTVDFIQNLMGGTQLP